MVYISPNRLRLSASKITTYKGCPLAYYLKYVEHVDVPSDVRTVFGKVIHSMLNDFYDKNFKSPDSFANAWKYRWFRECSGETLSEKRKKIYKIIEYNTGKTPIRLGTHIRFCSQSSQEIEPLEVFFGYMKLGENILKRFYEDFKPRPPPILKESSFELTIKGNQREHKVIVIFDRIDLKNGLPIIGDYKTDKKSPEDNPEDKAFQLHRHPQFTLYSLAFRQLIKEGRLKGIIPDSIEKEAEIWYYHLRSGKIFQTFRSEKDFEYVTSLLDDVADGILCQRFTPFYGFHCSMCPYQIACEKYSVNFGGPRIDLEGRIKPAKPISWDDDLIERDWIKSELTQQENNKQIYPIDKKGQQYFPFMAPQTNQTPLPKNQKIKKPIQKTLFKLKPYKLPKTPSQ
ncbi:MAG: PD-(D/E)XK nuclease family protein [Candidatus Pacearchaeota archaeon]|nr:PD-(D/E)XK nuclease family protein [Candidatus Pacearchaeota archaeon]